MLPASGIRPEGALRLEKRRHCSAPILRKRRDAVRWQFMVVLGGARSRLLPMVCDKIQDEQCYQCLELQGLAITPRDEQRPGTVYTAALIHS